MIFITKVLEWNCFVVEFNQDWIESMIRKIEQMIRKRINIDFQHQMQISNAVQRRNWHLNNEYMIKILFYQLYSNFQYQILLKYVSSFQIHHLQLIQSNRSNYYMHLHVYQMNAIGSIFKYLDSFHRYLGYVKFFKNYQDSICNIRINKSFNLTISYPFVFCLCYVKCLSSGNSFDLYSFNNQIYSYMTDKSESQLVLNTLSLIRLKPECKIMPTRVDFSTNIKQGSTQTSITPAFNNDKCFYTPAFTLPIDIKHYHKNLQIEKCHFEEKIKRSLQEITNLTHNSPEEEIIAVAPNSNYCQLCQERFEDYFTHILIKSHGIRMTQSEASQKIKELCSQFQANMTVTQVKGKTKLIKKQQKKEEKKVRGIKSNESMVHSFSTIEGLTITQNHSTGIIEDIPL